MDHTISPAISGLVNRPFKWLLSDYNHHSLALKFNMSLSCPCNCSGIVVGSVTLIVHMVKTREGNFLCKPTWNCEQEEVLIAYVGVSCFAEGMLSFPYFTVRLGFTFLCKKVVFKKSLLNCLESLKNFTAR